jgi:hypothetical protein
MIFNHWTLSFRVKCFILSLNITENLFQVLYSLILCYEYIFNEYKKKEKLNIRFVKS